MSFLCINWRFSERKLDYLLWKEFYLNGMLGKVSFIVGELLIIRDWGWSYKCLVIENIIFIKVYIGEGF